ncbi:MAG: glycosyltransferase [Bacteroidota bacterium]
MAKIYVLNNYSFERVWQEIRAGKKPNHHLYGINYLADAGHELILVPYDEAKKSTWSRFSKFWKKSKLPIPLGDLFQQFYVLKRVKKEDVIYAPCQTQTQLLSYLKAIGLLRAKIIVLAHHPPIRGKFKSIRQFFFRWELRGTDAYPALSQRIADRINQFKKGKSKGVHWGPDMKFYAPYISKKAEYFLAAGRTGRDFKNFAAACVKVEAPTEIICLQNDYNNHLKAYASASNIHINVNADEESYLYDQLTPVMAASKAICIPLFATKSNLAGLTSLTDALALGKAVLMTRNDFIDIDIEQEGIGIWLPAQDQAAWEAAIAQLQNDEQLCLEMGRKAKVLGARFWNSEVFAKEILELI